MESNQPGMHLAAEIATQPENWIRASQLAANREMIPHGARVAVLGCGTSWFMAQAFASLRESSGAGETDAFAASAMPLERDYDLVVALTRSGTTTEVLETVSQLRGQVPIVGLLGDPNTPFLDLVDEAVVLDFADEQSVVQTRFATSALAFLRASLGEDIAPIAAQAERAVVVELDDALINAEQYSFLGQGWATAIAHEAALKMREGAQAWTESYPSLEYRHGPMSIAQPGRVTWHFGAIPENLERDVRATGARFEHADDDPMVDLIRVQRVTLHTALAKGLNPDEPRNLARSVILDS